MARGWPGGNRENALFQPHSSTLPVSLAGASNWLSLESQRSQLMESLSQIFRERSRRKSDSEGRMIPSIVASMSTC